MVFGRVRANYDELWKAIIRPPRDKYDEKTDLGPQIFAFGAKPRNTFYRRDLELTNNRGLKLQCSHFEPTPGNRPSKKMPCVIYLHGNSSSRCEALSAVGSLLPMGLTVFCFDFAGCGKSEGAYLSLGYYEKDDLACVIDHLRKSNAVSTIGLWGRSMGAATALLHTHRDPSIAAMVLDSPFTDLKTLAKELVDFYVNVKIPKFLVNAVLNMVQKSIKREAKFDISDLRPIQYVDKSFTPALFVAGKSDTFIRPHHTQELHKAYSGEKNIILIEGDHNSMRPDFAIHSISIFLLEALSMGRELDGSPQVRIPSPARQRQESEAKTPLSVSLVSSLVSDAMDAVSTDQPLPHLSEDVLDVMTEEELLHCAVTVTTQDMKNQSVSRFTSKSSLNSHHSSGSHGNGKIPLPHNSILTDSTRTGTELSRPWEKDFLNAQNMAHDSIIDTIIDDDSSSSEPYPWEKSTSRAQRHIDTSSLSPKRDISDTHNCSVRITPSKEERRIQQQEIAQRHIQSLPIEPDEIIKETSLRFSPRTRAPINDESLDREEELLQQIAEYTEVLTNLSPRSRMSVESTLHQKQQELLQHIPSVSSNGRPMSRRKRGEIEEEKRREEELLRMIAQAQGGGSSSMVKTVAEREEELLRVIAAAHDGDHLTVLPHPLDIKRTITPRERITSPRGDVSSSREMTPRAIQHERRQLQQTAWASQADVPPDSEDEGMDRDLQEAIMLSFISDMLPSHKAPAQG